AVCGLRCAHWLAADWAPAVGWNVRVLIQAQDTDSAGRYIHATLEQLGGGEFDGDRRERLSGSSAWLAGAAEQTLDGAAIELGAAGELPCVEGAQGRDHEGVPGIQRGFAVVVHYLGWVVDQAGGHFLEAV